MLTVKRIFIGLLVLNVVYLLWGNYLADPMANYRALPANIEKITLLSERRAQIQALAEKELAQKQESEQTSQIMNAVSGCYTLGPFRDLVQLRNLTREIKPYVLNANFRGKEEKRRPLYWVYVAPEKSYKLAIEMGQRLKANNFNDFYVIREGEKKNGVSLGHFKSQAGAQQWSEKIAERGFNVQVEAVIKTYTLYWLDYQLKGTVNIPTTIFDKYIKKMDKTIHQLSRNCAT